jgi:hypothetical protein
MTDEEINNVAKIFEALTRAKDRNENIKIEYLNEEGETTFYTIDLNSDIQMIHFQVNKFGNIQLLNNEIPFFQQNIKDIQSITTFRTTELTFSETESEEESEEEDCPF